jgi:hypothetical protein
VLELISSVSPRWLAEGAKVVSIINFSSVALYTWAMPSHAWNAHRLEPAAMLALPV